MNSDNDSQQEQFIEQIEVEDAASIDDFIRELEAKEKDLQISLADGDEAVVQIEEADVIGQASAEADLSEKVVADLEEIFKSFNKQEKETAAAKVTAEQLQQANRELTALRAQVRRLEKEREEMREAMSRRQNDFENYRKRVERERAETRRGLVGDLAMRMLPVVDNLGRALDSAGDSAGGGGKSPEFQHFLDGISLVNRQLGTVLAEMGVEPIQAVGETFDPHLHEAAATEESGELPPNTVTQELLRGYRMGEKVIRHAVVKVSSAATTAARNADDEFDLIAWESQ
jgi:molecular chaperone GrpE